MKSNKLLSNRNKIYQVKDLYRFLFLVLFFLLIYSVILLFRIKIGSVSSNCVSDECMYFRLADNILNGFYSSPNPNPNLRYGPGYPLFVSLLKFLSINRQGIIFVNLFLSSLTIGIIYLAAKLFFKSRISIVLASLWGFYFIHYPAIFTAHSESLTCFTFLLSFYLFLLYEKTNIRRFFILSGISFGYLVLIKVIFSYVLLLLLCINFFNFVLSKKKNIFLGFSIIALVITLPYQIYTFNLTNKIFYFSDAGGEQLYWMSNPSKGEFGEWNNPEFNVNCHLKNNPCGNEMYKKNHGEFFEKISNLNSIDRDREFKKKAFENIRKSPIKYFRNIASNVSRMFFNIPFGYVYQRDITITRIIPNSILLTLILSSIIINIYYFRQYPNSIILFVEISFLYLFLSSLVSAYPRMLNVILPFIFIWTAFSISIWKRN